MLSTVDVPEALEKQYENNKKLAREIAGALYGGVERRLNAEVDLLSVDDLAYVYLRGPAYFKFYHTDRLLRMFSEGDIVPVGPRYPEKYAKIYVISRLMSSSSRWPRRWQAGSSS